MKATVEIPDDLLEEAMVITRARSKNELIEYALNSIIQAEKIKKLKSYKGKIDLDIDLDSLRKRNAYTG